MDKDENVDDVSLRIEIKGICKTAKLGGLRLPHIFYGSFHPGGMKKRLTRCVEG